MTQTDRTVLQKMIRYCDDISDIMQEFPGSPETFAANKTIRYAISMCVLQIGELINKLSPELIATNVQVPWRMIRAMRNLFAHSYEKTEPDILFETANEDIPVLKAQLEEILLNTI